MALPLNIPNYLEVAKISSFLAANDQNNVAKNQGGTIYPNLSRLIYIVRTAIEWQYGIDTEDLTLIDTGNYLKALIGKYASQAARILGGGGGIFINPPSGSLFGIIGNPIEFTIGNANSPMAVGDTTLVVARNNPIIGTDSVYRDNTVVQRDLSDRASYTVSYTTISVTFVFNVPVVFGEAYQLNFLRYTIN